MMERSTEKNRSVKEKAAKLDALNLPFAPNVISPDSTGTPKASTLPGDATGFGGTISPPTISPPVGPTRDPQQPLPPKPKPRTNVMSPGTRTLPRDTTGSGGTISPPIISPPMSPTPDPQQPLPPKPKPRTFLSPTAKPLDVSGKGKPPPISPRPSKAIIEGQRKSRELESSQSTSAEPTLLPERTVKLAKEKTATLLTQPAHSSPSQGTSSTVPSISKRSSKLVPPLPPKQSVLASKSSLKPAQPLPPKRADRSPVSSTPLPKPAMPLPGQASSSLKLNVPQRQSKSGTPTQKSRHPRDYMSVQITHMAQKSPKKFFNKFKPQALMKKLLGAKQKVKQEILVDEDQPAVLEIFKDDLRDDLDFPTAVKVAMDRLLQFNDVVKFANPEEIKQTLQQLEKRKILISIFGRHNAGKSTFLNAVVADELLPMNARNETSVRVSIKHDGQIHRGPCPTASDGPATDSACKNCPVLVELKVDEEGNMLPGEVIEKGSVGIMTKLKTSNRRAREGKETKKVITEYTVCGNIPAIQQAAAIDSSWEIYLVDNPGFGEAHSLEIMRVTESAMATSSAYIYIVAYNQIGDGKDRDCLKFIYNKDNGVFSDNRLLVVVTQFDERYTAIFEDEILSDNEIKDHICDLAAQEKAQCHLARKNVVPVCGQWAHIARKLQFHPDDEVLARKARKALTDYGTSNEALNEASSKQLSEFLLHASQIECVEERIKDMVSTCPQIWLKTICSGCDRYLRCACDALTGTANSLEEYITGEEEVYNKARKCQTDYEQLQGEFETSLSGEDSDIHTELMEKYTVDIQAPTEKGIEKAKDELEKFENQCTEKCKGNYRPEEFDKDVGEFLEVVTESVQDTVSIACKFDEMYKTLNGFMETLGRSMSDLRAAAEDFCGRSSVSSCQSDRLSVSSGESLGDLLTRGPTSLEEIKKHVQVPSLSLAKKWWRWLTQQFSRRDKGAGLREEEITGPLQELRSQVGQECSKYLIDMQQDIVQYFYKRYCEKARKDKRQIDEDFEEKVKQKKQELDEWRKLLDEDREDADTMRAWSSHLEQVHTKLTRKADEMWQRYSPKDNQETTQKDNQETTQEDNQETTQEITICEGTKVIYRKDPTGMEEASHGHETTETNAPSSDAAAVISEDEAVSQSEGYTAPSGSNTNDNEQEHKVEDEPTTGVGAGSILECASFLVSVFNILPGEREELAHIHGVGSALSLSINVYIPGKKTRETIPAEPGKSLEEALQQLIKEVGLSSTECEVCSDTKTVDWHADVASFGGQELVVVTTVDVTDTEKLSRVRSHVLSDELLRTQTWAGNVRMRGPTVSDRRSAFTHSVSFPVTEEEPKSTSKRRKTGAFKLFWRKFSKHIPKSEDTETRLLESFKEDFKDDLMSSCEAIKNRLVELQNQYGVLNIVSAELIQLWEKAEERRICIAILGHSNSGKSSLLNAVAGDKLLPIKAMIPESAAKVKLQHDSSLHRGECQSTSSPPSCSGCPVLFSDAQEEAADPVEVCRGSGSINKELEKINRRLRSQPDETEDLGRYTVRANIPILSCVPAPWEVCLVDNPGFQQFTEMEIERQLKDEVMSLSAYVYVARYDVLEDAIDAKAFKLISDQDQAKAAFLEHRLVIAVTRFDEFYTAVDDRERLNEEQVKDVICSSIKNATSREFPRDSVIPICSRWAFVARQLSFYPQNELLKLKALKCLSFCPKKFPDMQNRDVHPMAVASVLERVSGMKELETKIMQMSRRAYDESVFTMTNKFSSFLGAALKKLSQYLGDAEEVIRAQDERSADAIRSKQSIDKFTDGMKRLSSKSESPVYESLCSQIHQEIEAFIRKAKELWQNLLRSFKEDCTGKIGKDKQLFGPQELENGIEALLRDMSEQLGLTMSEDSFKNTSHCYEQHIKEVEDSCTHMWQTAYSLCTTQGAVPSPLPSRRGSVDIETWVKRLKSVSPSLSSLGLKGRIDIPNAGGFFNRKAKGYTRIEQLDKTFKQLQSVVSEKLLEYSDDLMSRTEWLFEHFSGYVAERMKNFDDRFGERLKMRDTEMETLMEDKGSREADVRKLHAWHEHFEKLQAHLEKKSKDSLEHFQSEL